MKVKVISSPYIFQVLYALCFTRPRYQVSVYRTHGPLVLTCDVDGDNRRPCMQKPATAVIVSVDSQVTM